MNDEKDTKQAVPTAEPKKGEEMDAPAVSEKQDDKAPTDSPVQGKKDSEKDEVPVKTEEPEKDSVKADAAGSEKDVKKETTSPKEPEDKGKSKGKASDTKDSDKDGEQDGSAEVKSEAETTSEGDASTTVVGPSGGEKKDADTKASGGPRRFEDKGVEKYWVPKTRLGKKVRDGDITSMEEVLDSGLILREPEIVDILLGELQDEVIDVNMVQRMTDSGRRVRFAVTVAVGNENGYLGLGRAHGREVGPTIRKAIDNAKINIISLKRGCGSWECSCGTAHSIPYRTHGKSGSVQVNFMPAPRGVGLAAGDVAKKILKLGGIKDLWATTRGQTQTTINYATAVYDALVNLSRIRINKRQQEKFQVITGGVEQ